MALHSIYFIRKLHDFTFIVQNSLLSNKGQKGRGPHGVEKPIAKSNIIVIVHIVISCSFHALTF